MDSGLHESSQSPGPVKPDEARLGMAGPKRVGWDGREKQGDAGPARKERGEASKGKSWHFSIPRGRPAGGFDRRRLDWLLVVALQVGGAESPRKVTGRAVKLVIEICRAEVSSAMGRCDG